MSAVLTSLREVVQELTGLRGEEMDPSASLVQMGLDSLVLTQFAQRLRREFGLDFSFRDFFGHLDTLAAIEESILQRRPELLASEPIAGPLISALPAAWAVGDSNDGLTTLLRDQLNVLVQQLEVLRRIEGGSPAFPEKRSAPPKAAAKPAPTQLRSRPTEPDDPRLTPHQEKNLREMTRSWNAKTAGSKAMVDRQRGAHADPRTAAGFDTRWKELIYPLVVSRSSGPYLWDVDGNRYVDLLNGFGPTFFGHGATFIKDAVSAQLERGFEIGPQTPLAGEAAATLCELTGLDRASFVCSGSESVQAAIRAARTYTSRDRIVVFSKDYHGNFDEVLVRGTWPNDRPRTLPAAPGVPQRAVDDVIVLEYGTDRALEEIGRLGTDLAAVIVEPVQTRQPDLQPREFLHEVRRMTRETGTVLVFDEVVTGFRCHPGGAQAVFGIEADLCTYGKVIGGGLPIGVLAGRRPFIDVLDGGPWQFGDDSLPTEGRTFFAGTFVRHPLVIAAAHAVLERFRSEGPGLQKRVDTATDRLAEGLNNVARELGLPVEVPHFSSIMYVRVLDGHNGLSSMFFHCIRDAGVFLLEGFPSYLTTAHEAEHIDHVIQAFTASGRRMQEAGFWPAQSAPRPVMDTARDLFAEPPAPNARLGRGPDGSPAWYVEDPANPGAFVRVE